MKSKLTEIFNSGDRGQIRLQFDEETGELYVNDRKVLYEVTLTKWQKILAFSVSVAFIAQGVVAVLVFIFKDWQGLMKVI